MLGGFLACVGKFQDLLEMDLRTFVGSSLAGLKKVSWPV